MSLHHTAMIHREKNWTITKTAEQFSVSIGLVSENLRLANAIDKNPALAKIETRQQALDKLRSM